LGPSESSIDELRLIPAFAEVPDEIGARFLATGRLERHQAGVPITARWEQARTFYLVREGWLSVQTDGHEVNVMGPGAHFGEIAAMDWGRDFSYGRTATVVPLERSALL